MRRTVISEPLRTPVGRFGGQFRSLSGHELGAIVIKALIERAGLPTDRIEDVIFAQCYPTMDAQAIGRVVALDAGLPIEAAGYQLDRWCGSGLQAVINACMQVASGESDLVIVGGAESMSNGPFYTTRGRWGADADGFHFAAALQCGRLTAGGRNRPVPNGMLETTENLSREHKISRGEQDEFALRSHQRAIAAQQKGRFDAEIVPVEVKSRRSVDSFTRDEHPRADASLEALSGLTSILRRSDPDATVTAGNASGQNDGAAACIVTTQAVAEELGLRPLASLRSWAVAGVAPETMGIGPVPACKKALYRAGLALKDMGLIELNEAFAAQALACTLSWKLADADFERLNVNGSGISLDHPVGAAGGRILATLLREMDRRGARYGIETMCIGSVHGLAAVFERVSVN